MTSMYQVSKLLYRHIAKTIKHVIIIIKKNNNDDDDNNKIISFSMINLLNLKTNVRKKYLKERL